MNKLTIEDAMKRALELALGGPVHGVNPRVGAVILNSHSEVIGEGFHKGAGTKHAEVVALEAALAGKTQLEPGCVAVVTLEPCNHQGRTGPCSKALIDAGISKVVFASSDPGDDSSGGAKTLEAAGIEVVSGILKTEADELIRIWAKATILVRPFVTLKWASSLDGRAAATDGTSKWISGEQSRIDAHQRRSEVDAILVGTGTALADDPELTARKADGALFEHQPLRVIIGVRELPGSLRVFNDQAETITMKTQSIHGALSELFERGVRHLMVEGGPTIASRFIQLDLVDEYNLYLAPKLLGGDRVAIGSIDVNTISDSKNLVFEKVSQLGEDLLLVLRPKESA